MRHVVMFSGGFDSTLVVCKVCLSYFERGDTVILLSVDNDITGPVKNELESRARNVLVVHFGEMFPEITFDTITIKVRGQGNLLKSGGYSVGLAQPLLWGMEVLPCLKDDDRVYFGYIKSDDIIPKMGSFISLLQAGLELQDKKGVSFEFPLKNYTKSMVLMELVRSGCLDLCFSCEGENLEKSPCGECTPCKQLKSALVLAIMKCGDGSTGDILREKLNQWFNMSVSFSY